MKISRVVVETGVASVRGALVRGALVGALCVGMVGQPLYAAEAAAGVAGIAGDARKPAAAAGQIQGQERVLHALNRLTFGPRPGDVAAVQGMGLERWFEMQLNAGSIDDSKLDARLLEYPAMQLTVEQLAAKYPSPGELRQMLNGRLALPTNPTDRAMVEDQLAFYKIAKAKQEAAGDAAKAAGGDAAMAAPSMADRQAESQPMAASDAGAVKKGKKARTQAQGLAEVQAEVQAGMAALQDDSMQDGTTKDKALPASEIAADPMMAGPGLVDSASRQAAMRVVMLPPDQRMRAILAMAPKELVKFRTSLGPAQLAQLAEGLTPQEKETLLALPGSLRMVALEAMESRVVRDVYSERQLEAVMTDFWLNHFNVYVRKNQNEPYLIPTYERATIRPRALGSFEDLLVATAKSPAMLVYLDNFRSVGPDSQQAGRVMRAKQMNPNGKLLQQASAGLNENYGRELMELHTLGVNGGYTQADVTNVAKVFTGWGLEKGYQGGMYRFDERRHEPGSKTVLGKTIREDGEKEGLEVLHMLATSPATAQFISEKLAIRFVSDTPPPTLVDAMAASFLKSNGDIKTVLRTMFHAPEFWAPTVYRGKVKTPEEFVISAVRASGAEVKNPQALVQSLDKLGMPLYGMQTPNGYSWMKDGWVSTGALVSRMNFSLVLSANRLPGTRVAWSELLGLRSGVIRASFSEGASAGLSTGSETDKLKKLEMILLGQPVSDRTRATVLGQSNDQNVTEQAATEFDLTGKGKGNYAGRGLGRIDGNGGTDDAQAAVMAGLLLGSPEFQRR